MKPVDPTDQPQETGIKVINPDDETKISAKDEDGQDVKVEIDENGNVIVTPNKDKDGKDIKVDGPITVTIEDPDLPGGKAEIEVPVNGHEKGKDDNNSDITVDESGKNPVNPTDEEQNTGVKVTNPGDDTKVTAKDEDGNDVPVRIDEDGNILVTPGENVDGPITVTIEDPRLPGGKKDVEIEVNDHKKGRDDNNSDKKATDRKGCTESLVGFGVPLLALIPLGIATQVAIPGLQGFKAQVDQQIRDMNTALQNQLGILDPNMAAAAAEFDARVKAAGANLGQVLGGLAVLAYGIAAVSTIIAKCGPGNKEYRDTKVDVSSIFGGSSIKQDKDDKGSSVEKKDLSSTPKDEDAKVDETKDEEKADEVEAPETPVVDEDETANE